MYKKTYTLGMKRSYSVASTRAKLAEIIDEVASGEDVEIVRRGKRVAILVSPARYALVFGERPGFGDLYAAFMRKHDPHAFGVDDDFAAELRDRSHGRPVKL
jgi:prevent-host-death family protein